MKILVISLLRLGDFIQAAPVIAGLQKKHPRAQIDVWVHTPVLSLRPLMPQIHRWFTIDREELQAGLGRAEIPLLTSFDVLREQCQQLSAEKYDLVVNLTQTEFSGWLTGYISAKTKIGMCFNSRGQAFFNSPWFRYLNAHTETAVSDVFNYTDIFTNGSEAAAEPPEWPLCPTQSGVRELANLNLPDAAEMVTIQALTSDTKKNWGAEKWREFLSSLANARPGAHFVLLGAPSERVALEPICAGFDDRSRFTIAILSLDGALALLNRSTLLVTGDTSIKHLANAASCQVMELSLGSSDLRRTGIYKKDSLIVQAKVHCTPCPHSSPCSQSSHACAEKLGAASMAQAAALFLNNDWDGLKSLGLEATGMEFLRTRILATGFWFAGDIINPAPLVTAMKWLDRSAHKFILGGEEPGPIQKFGSEAYQLGEEITQLTPDGIRPVLAHLDFLDSELGRRHVEAAARRQRFNPNADAGKVVDLAGLRSQQNLLEAERREIEVKWKLVRSLKTRLLEKS